jgi:glycosyltransferase involved in cell wall biosynthesis
MDIPRVTILMAVFNAEPFLQESVNSILNQTLGDFEVVIVEDKSTDRSLEILKSYHDPRIELVENPVNMGQTVSLMKGISMARGKYIARMDADDVCLPHRLQTQVNFLEQHPEISVLGSAVVFFDGKGYEFFGYQPEMHEAIKCELLFGFTMLHPSVMMRKAGLEQYGLNYDPKFACSQDHDLWTRSIRKMGFFNLQEPLLRMRNHGGQMGQTRKQRMHEESNIIRSV